MRAPSIKLAVFLVLAVSAAGAYSQGAAQVTAPSAPSVSSAAEAATTAPSSAPIEKSTVPEGRYEQRAERIHIEDASTAIDELKVGGETKSVTVQPKNSKLPEYEILQPRSNRAAGAVSRDGSDGAQQPRVWSIKKF